ncbi:MAG: hypothetical protein GX607_05045 [Myxococcales bacterium]|jgi:3-phosphoshikimate 1-carboxyvinyltransferase|nr:hypothetical protein [Myxococcales bacterium]
MTSQLIIHPAEAPLRGSVPAPADPIVTMIALGVAACAEGASRLALPRVPEPVAALAEALRQVGVVCDSADGELVVHGRGLFGLTAPDQVLDARGAPLAASVLAGLLASRPFESVLWVDDAWAGEVVPLLGRAHPLDVEDGPEGGRAIRFASASKRAPGVQLRLPGVRCWAKVALLLAALRASRSTFLEEGLVSPDHCERLLQHVRLPVETSGVSLTLHPPRDADAIRAFELPEVGDVSAGAYLVAAAALVPGSHVTVRGVGLNPSRTALLEGLRSLGVQAGITPRGDALAEPVGELTVFGQGVRGGVVAGEVGARLGDDFVPLALLGAAATDPLELGDLLPGSTVSGRGERDVARVVGVLRTFGLEVLPLGAEGVTTGLTLREPARGPLRATSITTGGDPRLALAATVLALRADGPTTVDDVDCLRQFFPRWVGTLRALGARVEVRA